MKKLLAALSGGVDSAAAALFLLDAGFEVAGGTMLLRPGQERDVEDAARVCRALGIDFYPIDLRDAFEQCVVEPFGAVYRAGGTPNPCYECNRRLKFGALLDWALGHGFDGLATGHYARTRMEETGRTALLTAAERARDQSYFLAGLTQAQLERTVFPLGGRTKAEARARAQAAGLPVAHKHDSQDICFVPDGDYLAFLRARGMQPQAGWFLVDGRPAARHAGMEAYTPGQRRGLGYAAGERVYVIEKRGTDVVLGPEELLFTRTVRVRDLNYVSIPPQTEPFAAEGRLRSGPRRSACRVVPEGDGCARLEFSEPQRAAAPGQKAVVYDGERVLAGGEIY